MKMMRPLRALGLPVFFLFLLPTVPALAQMRLQSTFPTTRTHDTHMPPDSSPRTHRHEEELHFSHPLVTESPTPDTKFRFDYAWSTLDARESGYTDNLFRIGGEYAFHRSFSIEVEAPFVRSDPNGASAASALGNVEVAFKFANYAFEEQGLLLGYGLELGLPTGDASKGIGSDHIVDLEPFFYAGLKRGRFEAVGFAIFGIPTNQRPGEEIDTEFGYNLSVLYHVSRRVQGLLEFDGATTLSGAETEAATHVTPGLKFRPLARSPLLLGVGLSLPVSGDRSFDARGLVSLFYHL